MVGVGSLYINCPSAAFPIGNGIARADMHECIVLLVVEVVGTMVVAVGYIYRSQSADVNINKRVRLDMV